MTADTVRMSAKVAPLTMYAHRLWITLWMSLGDAGENRAHPGGNAAVTLGRTSPAHSQTGRRTRAGHSHCAWSRPGLAGQIRVIPRIHRPYDDYQFCFGRQIPTQVAKCAELNPDPVPSSVLVNLAQSPSRVARPEFDEFPTR
jgi:hypothetical protein